jgi:hypothetical protein
MLLTLLRHEPETGKLFGVNAEWSGFKTGVIPLNVTPNRGTKNTQAKRLSRRV